MPFQNKEYFFVDELPKSNAGKILKREIRKTSHGIERQFKHFAERIFCFAHSASCSFIVNTYLLETHPGEIPSAYDNAGFVNASAEDGAYEQSVNQVCAAVYLHALTGESAFSDFLQQHRISSSTLYPLVRGRLSKINGVPANQAVPDEAASSMTSPPCG